MSTKEYSYQQNLPIINVEVIGPKGSLQIRALVDSGASISLFNAQIAEIIGIEFKKGKRVELSGIGGKIRGYLHKIPILVNDKRFECKIVFSSEIFENVNLLGRGNFFLPFLITFNERDRKFFLQENR